jgi:hypothetical protein
MQKVFLFIIALLLNFQIIFGQEVVVPIRKLNNLTHKPTQIKQLNKTSKGRFPLIDLFTRNGAPDTLQWLPSQVAVLNRTAIFNALDVNGNPYGLGNTQDELISWDMNLTGETGEIFVSFSYAQGSTAGTGDSLVLFGKDVFGQWVELWKSVPNQLKLREVTFNLPLATFQSAAFALKFSLFTDNSSAGNTQSFLMSKLVLASKPMLGIHENFRSYEVPDSIPLKARFAAPDVWITTGKVAGYPWGNMVKLDALDANKAVYQNADNSYGGCDTLYMHPMNIIQYAASDSIFFSFSCMPSMANLPQDSLIVEFKNNLGNWVRVCAFSGNMGSGLINQNFNVNFGRNRHAFFQPRFTIKTQRASSNQAFWYISGIKLIRRIELPLFDDFSDSRVIPDKNRWVDKDVYINNDFPVRAPSVNVATFDGLNENGVPYSTFAIKGICDKLTSRSMNLSGLGPADSVILSFYFQYEPQGLNNQYFQDDSLIIEARGSRFDPDSFIILKMFSGEDSLFFKFHYFGVALTNPKFFHDDFQFRIKNRGSLTGNVSQWHVDYVRFNKGRKLQDPIKDIALTNAPAIFLGPYSQMPWNHYQLNKSRYRNTPNALRVKNHDNQPYAIDYFRSVLRPEGDTLDKFIQIIGSLPAFADTNLLINKPFDFATTVSSDSLVFETRYKVKVSGTALDNVPTNDNFTVKNIFSNYFAYDDGTAEGGYGVQLKTNVGGCLKYYLEQPDSIVGLYVYYNRSEQNVSTQRFNLKIWKRISPLGQPATSDEVLWSLEQISPTYTNTINGFTSYRFPKAVAVSDSFYIGWDQVNAFVVNIGLDKNYRFGVNPNMAYKMDGRWYASETDGALMMRPIMGKFLGSATSNPEIIEPIAARQDIGIYPNPLKHSFTTTLENPQNYSCKLYDLNGRLIGNLSLDGNQYLVPALQAGFYIVVFENLKSGEIVTKKIIIEE